MAKGKFKKKKQNKAEWKVFTDPAMQPGQILMVPSNAFDKALQKELELIQADMIAKIDQEFYDNHDLHIKEHEKFLKEQMSKPQSALTMQGLNQMLEDIYKPAIKQQLEAVSPWVYNTNTTQYNSPPDKPFKLSPVEVMNIMDYHLIPWVEVEYGIKLHAEYDIANDAFKIGNQRVAMEALYYAAKKGKHALISLLQEVTMKAVDDHLFTQVKPSYRAWGGPLDGQWIAAEQPWLKVPFWEHKDFPKPNMMVEGQLTPLTVDWQVYEYRLETITFTNLLGVMVDKDTGDMRVEEAIETTTIWIAPEEKERFIGGLEVVRTLVYWMSGVPMAGGDLV